MMNVGISTACFFKKFEIEDSIEQIAKLGIKNIETYLGAYSEYTPDFMHELKRRADDNGIKICSMHTLATHFEPNFFVDGTRTQRDAFDMFERVLEGGEIMGAGVYVFHGSMQLKRKVSNSMDISFVAEITDRIASVAANHGIKLGFENVHWCMYDRPGFAEQLKKLCTSDNLYFTLDVKQAVQSGYPVSDYIDDMGSRLANVHICDVIPLENGLTKTALPLRGAVDFLSIRDKLKSTGYSGNVMLELYAHDYASLGELKDCYLSVKELFEG